MISQSALFHRRSWTVAIVAALLAGLVNLSLFGSVAHAAATSTTFAQTSVTLATVNSQATITVQTVNVDAGADGVQVNVQHTGAVTVTSVACVGIFNGATVVAPSATTGGTLVGCQFFTAGQNVSAVTGNVLTFVLTRTGNTGPLLSLLTTGAFGTQFTDGGTAIGPGTTNTLQVQLGAAPTVTSVAPNNGSTAGGTAVTITGTGFLSGAVVMFGAGSATNVTVVNATTITATTPAGVAGATSVMVTNADNQMGTLAAGFTFTGPVVAAPTVSGVTPSSGVTAGGTSVTITGTGFVSGATVTFGGTAATSVTVVNATVITATTPAKAAGVVNVVVTNPDTQVGTLTNGFTFSNAFTGAIPSVSEWGLIALAVLLAGGFLVMRRRPQPA